MYQKQHKASQDHLCTGCKNIIGKGTEYVQVGLIPRNKDYHVDCLPKTEPTPVVETKVRAGPGKPTPEAVFESTMIDPEPQTQEPEVKQVRDTKGRFAKKGGD